jgi:hypothetical protein
MPLVLAGATSGSTTIQATDAVTQTITLPAQTGTVMVNGPAFSAYQSGTAQTLSSGTFTKIQFQTEEFDTNSNYDNATNYRFTPTVAGYYQLNANTTISGSVIGNLIMMLYKNGSAYRQGMQVIAEAAGSVVSSIVYANGSTDYFEVYLLQGSGVSKTLLGGSPYNSFTGAMIRGA